MECTEDQRRTLVAIAAALGEEWQLETAGYARLVTPGLALSCHFQTYGAGTGRLDLSLDASGFYNERYHGETIPSITVDSKRPAANLAKDISRRLIPQARELLDRMKARKALADAAQQAHEARLAELALALGTEVTRDRVYRNTGSTSVTAEAYGDRVKIDLSVPVGLALHICRLVVKADRKPEPA